MSPGFGVYIHWPFCLSKCPYCDFNSHVSGEIDHLRWRNALLTELGWFAALAPANTVTSIFFGGGTPSLMEPATVGSLIGAVGRLWPTASDLEISLEANPSSAEAARFTEFRAAGVQRLSLGVQALDDPSLKILGRRHDLAEALAAIALARNTFPRFSFDLIYARPGQSLAAWQAELGQALTLAGDHLSLYQLTKEEGTAFARSDISLPDDDTAAAMFEWTGEATAAAGLPAYEISNHARPGHECRHNLTYWLGGDYVGIGPGAHGRLSGNAFHQHRHPQTWLSGVEALGHGTAGRERLDPATRIEEMIMMGLRLINGIEFAPLAHRIDPHGLARMIEGGFAERIGSRLRATARGRLVLNALTAELLANS